MQVNRDTYSYSDLVESLKQGDLTAFNKLYKAIEPKLYAFTYKMLRDKEETEEVVQDVFVKVWEKKHLFDPQQNIESYIFSISKNIVYNRAKRKVYELALKRHIIHQNNISENATDNTIDYQELNQILDKIFDAMPPARKQVFIMSRIEGLSNKEIAVKLNTSISNIENHINKALRGIREIFKNYKITYILLLYLFL